MPFQVALLGSPKAQQEFKMLYRRLKERGIPAIGIGLTSQWSSRKNRLVEKLGTVTHLVVFLEPEQGWFSFVEGFAAARIPQGVAYLPLAEEFSSSEHHASPTILPLFTNPEPLVEYLESEKQRITREEERTEAREYIVNAGIGLSEENMAHCVEEGNIDLVKRFLALGYSPDTVNARGIPLLILAIRKKHFEMARLLIDAKADVNKLSVDRGSSPLMEAVAQGDLSLVEALIEQGADLDLRSKNGQTALMLAIGEGKGEIARLLLQKGADTSPVDALGMTAKKYAELFKQTEILIFFEEKSKDRMGEVDV
ncbi:MAG: hypothetical protein Kow009_12260 [Spirochaetales bacterium]